MEKRSRTRWDKLREYLVEQSWKQYHCPLQDIKWFAGIIVSGAYDMEYLHGEIFWMHCEVLRLDHLEVFNMIEIIKRGPSIEKRRICNS